MPTPPYLGILPFEGENASCFFGRDQVREIVTANLLASRVSVLYGPQGVGKTSVLQAGVACALRQSGGSSEEAPRFTVVTFKSWRTDPLGGLIEAVCRAVPAAGTPDAFVAKADPLIQVVKAAAAASRSVIVLLLDQFEQCCTRCDGDPVRERFAEALSQLLQGMPSCGTLLISMREEAMAKLSRFKMATSALQEKAYHLEDLAEADARKAVTEPILRHAKAYAEAGWPTKVDSDLVKAVVQEVTAGQEQWDAAAGSGDLAPPRSGLQARFLEMIMTHVWEYERQQGSDTLRLASLAKLGGADAIVQQHLRWSIGRLENWIDKTASGLASGRIARLARLSTAEEKNTDREQAEIRFADEVLEGRISLATNVPTAGYALLADCWLNTVKRHRAYFLWRQHEASENSWDEKRYYYRVCEYLRQRLVDRSIKAQPEQFGKIGDFLEASYLTNGRLDREKDKTRALLGAKAGRIWLRTGARQQTVAEQSRDWHDAEVYSRLFYDNIIGAVEDRDSDKILAVLKALQFTPDFHTGHYVINCFEAAIALYFLDAEIINEHWKRAERTEAPPANHGSAKREVLVTDWPASYQVPDECVTEFFRGPDRVGFVGMMTNQQRDALLRGLVKTGHIDAIEDLYAKTHVIHRENTL